MNGAYMKSLAALVAVLLVVGLKLYFSWLETFAWRRINKKQAAEMKAAEKREEVIICASCNYSTDCYNWQGICDRCIKARMFWAEVSLGERDVYGNQKGHSLVSVAQLLKALSE